MSLSNLWKHYGYKSAKQKAFEARIEERRQEEQRELHRRELEELQRQVQAERRRLRDLREERNYIQPAPVASPYDPSEPPSPYRSDGRYTGYGSGYYQPLEYTGAIQPLVGGITQSQLDINAAPVGVGGGGSGGEYPQGISSGVALQNVNDISYRGIFRDLERDYVNALMGISGIRKKKKKGKAFLPEWL